MNKSYPLLIVLEACIEGIEHFPAFTEETDSQLNEIRIMKNNAKVCQENRKFVDYPISRVTD